MFKSTDSATNRQAVNTGFPEQVAACTGDCAASGTVTGAELVTLVNIALGNAQPSACPHGVPIGGNVDIAVIIQAVNSALNCCACRGGDGPHRRATGLFKSDLSIRYRSRLSIFSILVCGDV